MYIVQLRDKIQNLQTLCLSKTTVLFPIKNTFFRLPCSRIPLSHTPKAKNKENISCFDKMFKISSFNQTHLSLAHAWCQILDNAMRILSALRILSLRFSNISGSVCMISVQYICRLLLDFQCFWRVAWNPPKYAGLMQRIKGLLLAKFCKFTVDGGRIGSQTSNKIWDELYAKLIEVLISIFLTVLTFTHLQQHSLYLNQSCWAQLHILLLSANHYIASIFNNLFMYVWRGMSCCEA